MGQVITDVGIDLDGVIYPFADAFREYCLERMDVNDLPEPQHWNFYEDWGLDSETFYAWLREAAETHEVFATHDPYEGVINAWHDLRDMNVKIHVLTARPQSAWAQTAEWLSKHKLHVDTLHFGPTKGLLASIATGKSILIDDHVAYYEESERNGIIPVLMDRAWNAHKENANRVSSMTEFVSFIRGYNTKISTVKTSPVIPRIGKDLKKPITNPYNPHTDTKIGTTWKPLPHEPRF